MLWKYQVIKEAEALGELGEFFLAANVEDVEFLRTILAEWNKRRADIPTDLMSVAASAMLYNFRRNDDAFEHACLVLMERIFEADTETLKKMAQMLPARKGHMHRLNSKQRGIVRKNFRVLSNQALDNLWPGDTLPEIDDWPEIGVDEAEAAAEPAKSAPKAKAAKPAPKAKAALRAKTAKAKKVTKPAAKRAPRKSKAA